MTDSPLHLDHPDAPRIIVLGATGYAGSLVVDALVAQGARPVLCLLYTSDAADDAPRV